MKRKNSGLGEAAHVSRVFVGRNVNDPKRGGRKIRELTDREIKRMADEAADGTSGAVTRVDGHGRYTSADKKNWVTKEKTAVIHSTVAGSVSCDAVIARMRKLGTRFARLGKQDSVLVEVRCADGKVDAALMRRNGKPYPLFPMRSDAEWARLKRLHRVKRKKKATRR